MMGAAYSSLLRVMQEFVFITYTTLQLHACDTRILTADHKTYKPVFLQVHYFSGTGSFTYSYHHGTWRKPGNFNIYSGVGS
jgi:hypothetical protein